MKNICFPFLFIFFLVSLIFVDSSCAAPVFYVATTGDDANNCTSTATPCLTLAGALTRANGSAGATIQIAAGTYTATNASIYYQTFSIVGAGMDQTILDGGGTDRVFAIIGSTINLSGLTVRNGHVGTSGMGAGIAQWGGTMVLDKVRVTGNTADQGDGAGIYISGSLTMTNSIINANTCTGSTNLHGGGMFIDNGSGTVVSLESTTIFGNSASQAGGVHIQGAGSIKMTNVTISGNTASRAGAVTITGTGTTVMENVTITGNTSTDSGAPAVQNYGTVSWVNSIIANNSGPDCNDGSSPSTWTSIGHNLSSDATCLFTQTGDAESSDPLLTALGEYGGVVPTHALKPGSPAIDTGTNSSCPAADARGETRPQDGDNDSTATCDKGAFEFARVNSTGVTISGDSAGYVNSSHTFRADVLPVVNTFPITYTWTADGQTNVVHTGNSTDSVTFTWSGAGTKTVGVTANNGINSVNTTHQIVISTGTQAVTGVTISGPTTGSSSRAYSFTATVAPTSTTVPITYTWKVDGGAPVVQTGQGATATLANVTFGSDGAHTVEVTADNTAGNASDTHAITIASWYVNDSTGADTNTCTSAATPCKTIREAINQAVDGGTIFVAAGTYQDSEVGTAGKSLAILGSGSGSTVMDGGGTGAVFWLQNSGPALDITLADMTIRNGKRVASSGGGIYNDGTNLTLQRVIVEDNYSQGNGGGIYSNGGTLTVTDSILRNNSISSVAGTGGTALVNYGGTLNMRNTAVISNPGSLAALFCVNSGTSTLTNVTISGNGVGIETTPSATVTAVNLTIASNREYGIENYGTVNLLNTVLANNTAGNCASGAAAPPVSQGYNLDSDDTCSLAGTGDQVKVNPGLASLALYKNTWLHTFSVTSPLLDRGTNTGCPATDQAGTTRSLDGDGKGGATCDIGAFEYDPASQPDRCTYFVVPIKGGKAIAVCL